MQAIDWTPPPKLKVRSAPESATGSGRRAWLQFIVVAPFIEDRWRVPTPWGKHRTYGTVLISWRFTTRRMAVMDVIHWPRGEILTTSPVLGAWIKSLSPRVSIRLSPGGLFAA